MTTIHRHVQSLQPNNETYPIIAIDGPGGAGKSTFARLLHKLIDNHVLLHGDDYFEPAVHDDNPSLPGKLNLDRFMQDTGYDIQAGRRDLTYRPYDWRIGNTVTRNLFVNGGIIYEGVKSLELPLDWDITIWVTTPRDERFKRCVEQRTDAERKATGASKEQLADRFNAWADEAETYQASIHPEENVTCIIDGQAPFSRQIRSVTQALNSTRN